MLLFCTLALEIQISRVICFPNMHLYVIELHKKSSGGRGWEGVVWSARPNACVTSRLCYRATVCEPPLDFTHRLHFCRFHQHPALYIQPPAARGEIGSSASPSISTRHLLTKCLSLTSSPIYPCLFLCQPFLNASQTSHPSNPQYFPTHSQSL